MRSHITMEELEASAAALVAELSELDHPDLDELFAYVDGQQSDDIAAHLRECEQCSADVADAAHERDRLSSR